MRLTREELDLVKFCLGYCGHHEKEIFKKLEKLLETSAKTFIVLES